MSPFLEGFAGAALAAGTVSGIAYALLRRRVRHAMFVLKNLEDAAREAKAAPPAPEPRQRRDAREIAAEMQREARATAERLRQEAQTTAERVRQEARETRERLQREVRETNERVRRDAEHLRRTAWVETQTRTTPDRIDVFSGFSRDMNAMMGDMSRVMADAFSALPTRLLLSDVAPGETCPTCGRLRIDASISLPPNLDVRCTCSAPRAESASGSPPREDQLPPVKDKATSPEVKGAGVPEGQKPAETEAPPTAWDHLRNG